MAVPSTNSAAPIAIVSPFAEKPLPSPAVHEPLVRFYANYPPLAGALPHHNPRNGANLLALKVTCDDCGSVLPLDKIHGLINDYVHCTEVRYAGSCPECHRTVHNVLRMAGDELRFIRDGKWCVSIKRPWWHCLWPWPIDREWS